MTNKTFKIATWNICLGISNKLKHIEETLNSEKIDIMFIQEAEIQNQTNESYYNIKNYKFLVSNTIKSGKSRLCCYIKDYLKVKVNLIENFTTEVISLTVGEITINGIYRPFKIPHHNNHAEYIEDMITTLNGISTTKYTLLLGDFNLDSAKKFEQNYPYHNLFELLDEHLDQHHLQQMKHGSTWQRIVNQTLKESTLDHIYINDDQIVNKLDNTKQHISDHNLLVVSLNLEPERSTFRRKMLIQDWTKYDATKIAHEVQEGLQRNFNTLNAQEHLSQLNQLICTSMDKYVRTIKVKANEIGSFFSMKMIRLRRQRSNLYRRFKKN